MVRNEQLIDPAAGAVIGDSAPAPCHVGNQVLYNLAMIHSSEPLSSVRSYGINSAVATARRNFSSRPVPSRPVSSRLVSSRGGDDDDDDDDVGGRRVVDGRSTLRFNAAVDQRFILRPTTRTRYFMRSRQKGSMYSDTRNAAVA